MQRELTILFSLFLGAAFVAGPSLMTIAGDSAYETALAAKGGNGKGNGGANGKTGGNQTAGKSGSSKSKSTTSVASQTAGKQKSKDKQLALSDPTVPAHPSMLGRWNAAKPIDHPAIQTHMRKGKFNGTIGMVAAYAQAQMNYDNYQSSLANADPAVSALASALSAAGYKTVADYQAAVTAGLAQPDAAIDGALNPTTTGDTTTTAMTADQIAEAEALTGLGATAFDDLSSAEANMELYSNRAPWSDIRDDVRAKMGLDPTENDLVTDAPTDPAEPLSP